MMLKLVLLLSLASCGYLSDEQAVVVHYRSDGTPSRCWRAKRVYRHEGFVTWEGGFASPPIAVAKVGKNDDTSWERAGHTLGVNVWQCLSGDAAKQAEQD